MLGLTEVDSASHPIEDSRLLERLKEKEERRQKSAEERAKRRRKLPPATNGPTHLPPLPLPFAAHSLELLPSLFAIPSSLLPLPHQSGVNQCRLLPVDQGQNDEDDNEDPVDVIHVHDGDDSVQALTSVAFENQMKRLFSQSRKNMPKKTLLCAPRQNKGNARENHQSKCCGRIDNIR